MKTYLFAFAAVATQLGASSVIAEPLSTYVEECKTALGVDRVPGYSCIDGISIPSSDGFSVLSSNNYLGTVETGNPEVDAVFLCRDFDAAAGTARLNGYILQNRSNGNICFFDARPNTTGHNLPDIDSVGASANWREPSELVDDCQDCHSNDPFIVSSALAFAFRELRLLYDDRPYLGPYRIVGTTDPASHFYEWESDAKASWFASSCADSCHRLSSGLIEALGNELIADGLMPPAVGSIYDDVPASSLIMASAW